MGKMQERMQALQEQAKAGDQAAAQELQAVHKEFVKLQAKALEILEKIRQQFSSIGQEDKFHESQLGQLYEQFQGALEG